MEKKVTIINKLQKKLRHEYKHQINPLEGLVLSKRLDKVFIKDKNSNEEGFYTITSLYFDTPYDDAYKDKINGLNKREKFRIRYYNQNIKYIKLEKKYKVNGLCGKRATILNENEVYKIINKDYSFLLESNDALKIELYAKIKSQTLRPKTVVRYDRRAYIYQAGNTRITLDNNLRTCLNIKDFFKEDNYYIKVEDNGVLEIKYDEYIPEIVKRIANINRKSNAYSKYAICRKLD